MKGIIAPTAPTAVAWHGLSPARHRLIRVAVLACEICVLAWLISDKIELAYDGSGFNFRIAHGCLLYKGKYRHLYSKSTDYAYPTHCDGTCDDRWPEPWSGGSFRLPFLEMRREGAKRVHTNPVVLAYGGLPLWMPGLLSACIVVAACRKNLRLIVPIVMQNSPIGIAIKAVWRPERSRLRFAVSVIWIVLLVRFFWQAQDLFALLVVSTIGVILWRRELHVHIRGKSAARHPAVALRWCTIAASFALIAAWRASYVWDVTYDAHLLSPTHAPRFSICTDRGGVSLSTMSLVAGTSGLHHRVQADPIAWLEARGGLTASRYSPGLSSVRFSPPAVPARWSRSFAVQCQLSCAQDVCPLSGATYSYGGIWIPYWIPLSLLVGLSGWTTWKNRRYRSGRCGRCGYDLRGNESGICSECGLRLKAAQRGQPNPIT